MTREELNALNPSWDNKVEIISLLNGGINENILY